MVIRIMCQGGLGNQLFTLNAAHFLSSNLNARVELTFDAPSRHADRPVQIGGLLQNCSHDITTTFKPSIFRFCDLLDRIGSRFDSVPRFVDSKYHFLDSRKLEDPLKIPSRMPLLVRGYFQNSNQVIQNIPIYLDEINSFLESVVAVPELPAEYQAFHIRRGDYVEHRETLGELKSEYYLSTRDNSLPLVITTDEVGPTGELQKCYPNARIVGPKDASVWSSFKILSQAKKLTIANSTYSWWAGVMARSLNAEVVRPKRWNKIETLSSQYLSHPEFLEVENTFA